MAITLDGTTGITTPGLTNTGTETLVNLTTTGNTTLGDATTDTLTVGVTGIVKDASGNVGIGTASPSNKLVVSNAGAAGIELSISGTATLLSYNRSTSVYTDFGFNAQTLLFNTGSGGSSSERMRIDSSGNLLVGTTSQIATGLFNVKRTSANNVASFQNGSDAGYGIGFYNVAGTAAGSISWSASVTTYSTSSDYRLKENIAPMTGALAKVTALKPVTYKWKLDDSDGQGFIAHELAEVVPDAVVGEKDAVDADGNPVYQGIDTSFLVATLTAAIQEQQALIQSLTTRITALETP